MEENKPVPRRTFLGYTVAAVTSFVGIVAGVPTLGYLASPLQAKEEGKWISLGKVTAFAPDVPQIVAFSLTHQDGWVEVRDTRTVWVVPQKDGQFVVFNGHCTHLGCAISWKSEGPTGNKFVCPCHDGVYDKDGEVLAGPPPRALDKLDTKIENDELFALYQDFRLGVEEKVPV